MRPFRGTRVEGGLRRSCPQQASLSACPMPTRSATKQTMIDIMRKI
ncbi:MAG: hypothetical protein JTT16_05525 [Candidatus Brockarchaeota archaeon]|nr:hypothetical protein [Candidatus Brockarchaeota archaeon]